MPRPRRAGDLGHTKKKELVGAYQQGGREWQPSGEPVAVRVHDFLDDVLGKVIPYGVYDLARNTPGGSKLKQAEGLTGCS